MDPEGKISGSMVLTRFLAPESSSEWKLLHLALSSPHHELNISKELRKPEESFKITLSLEAVSIKIEWIVNKY